MELVFIATFQTIASANGFYFMGLDRTNVMDDGTILKYYRSFVWGRLFDQVKMERRRPGGVEKEALAKGVYDRRCMVCYLHSSVFFQFDVIFPDEGPPVGTCKEKRVPIPVY